jgi:hypothetical protein
VAAGEALAAAEVRAQQRLSALAEAFVGLMG